MATSSSSSSSYTHPHLKDDGVIQWWVGDLLKGNADMIVQQTNCVTVIPHGLAEQIATTFPYANVYAERKAKSRNTAIYRAEPGSVIISRPPIPTPSTPNKTPLYKHLDVEVLIQEGFIKVIDQQEEKKDCFVAKDLNAMLSMYKTLSNQEIATTTKTEQQVVEPPRTYQPFIAHLMAQIAPGHPSNSTSRGTHRWQSTYKIRAEDDDKAHRLAYFVDSLQRLLVLISEDPSLLFQIKTIAFPYKIGCGLAGGSWVDYLKVLETFAAEAHSKGIQVLMVQREEDLRR